MHDKSLDYWTHVFVAVSLGAAAFGAVLCVGGAPVLNLIYLDQVDPVFWPDAVPQASQEFQRFSYAVIGATVSGLALVVAWMAHHGLRQGHRWVADGIALGLLAWFALDTSLSLVCGVWMNALVNTAFLLALLTPLLLARRYTEPARDR